MSSKTKIGSKRKVSSSDQHYELKKISLGRVTALEPDLKQKRGMGVVLTCGQGECGQLGLGVDIMERSRATLVPGLDHIVDIYAGGMHTLCLNNDGKVYSWGCNDEGALGRDTCIEGSETEPGEVQLNDKVVQISAGDSHSAALTESGKVYAWGSFRDSHGTMGLTSKGNEKLPILVAENIAKISSGTDHLLLLQCNGKLYSCGCAEQGQLGRIPERSIDRGSRQGLHKLLDPDLVSVNPRIKHKFDEVWSGAYTSFLREHVTGNIYAFGLNNYYQLGLKEAKSYLRPVIVKSFGSESWIEISGGQHHTLALNNAGKTYVLGRKEYGRLGLGEECSDAKEPVLIPGLQDKKVTNIACGSCVSFAVTDEGEGYSWGMGTSSQLGCGGDEDVFEPQLITGKQLESRSIIKISAGGQHTVLLVKDKS